MTPIPCDVSRCMHEAYIAVTFHVTPNHEYFYCEVHDARTEDGPRAKRRFGWHPNTISSVRRL